MRYIIGKTIVWLSVVLVFHSIAFASSDEKDWSSWQCVYGVTTGGGIDLRYRREGGAWVSWDWQFRNRYNQPVIVRFSRLNGKGERLKNWVPIKPQSLSTPDTNMSGEIKPDVEIIQVEFQKNR